MTNKTPFDIGFRMPAEWERHEATWLSWPKDPLTFPPHIIERVQKIYIEMIEALQKGERVDLLVDDQKTEDQVTSLISSTKNIRFHKIKSADVWMRDYGPIFVKNLGEVAATKWNFNAWGKKYDELLKDNQSGMEVCKKTGFKIFEPSVVLEGGSIDVNGNGLCLTTKQCLLNRNRNPKLTAGQIENYFHDYLGVTEVIWLSEGISGDDTDGHVDDIARFVSPTAAVCMVEEDKTDDNYAALERNYQFLRKFVDKNGRKLDVLPIAMPDKLETEEGRLPASYANFYIGNTVVLVPIFGNSKKDEKALIELGNFFTNREIIGIYCKELVYGFGGIHCVTQQQPAGK
ncbi:MAG: agmatine deiminase family protein, partial [Nitrososphaerota archaeon]|nr:agmatine deiminase family protein [Nitrososphaerota archaeon]